MKIKSYCILFLLIYVFEISHIYIASERPFIELRPLVDSFFYCFDGKPGIIYYRKFFNKYSSELYNSEFYRNRDKNAILIKKIEQRAHDKAIQTIKKEQYLVREQIMRSSGYEDYVEQLIPAREYREECYKKILYAKNLTGLLYIMLNTLQNIGFSQDNIYWQLKKTIKDAINIDNPGLSVYEKNKTARQIIEKLSAFEKKKIVARLAFRKYSEKRKKRIVQEKEAKISKTTTDLFDAVKNWFKSWWQ